MQLKTLETIRTWLGASRCRPPALRWELRILLEHWQSWGGQASPGRMGMGCSDQPCIVRRIPHHQMGVMMASMAQINSHLSELQPLHGVLQRLQSEEIRQMVHWYPSWY